MEQATEHYSIGQQAAAESPDSRTSPAKHCRQFAAWVSHTPVSARLVFAVFLLAALAMALHSAFGRGDASVRLKVQHGFHSADLSVWVDGRLAYTGKLAGSTRKRFGLIPAVQGSMSETVPLSSGTRRVRVRVVSSDRSVQEDTISGDFAHNTQKTLLVVARSNDLSLNWRSAEASGSEPASLNGDPSSPGWFSRYGGSLLLTIAGSIISALTGFAIKELPKQIGFRQGASPKL